MADLSKNRDNLYNIVYDFKVNVKKGTYTRAQFDQFFINESSFIVFVEWLQGKITYNISPFQKLKERTTSEFYIAYVCDDNTISWAAASKGCQGINVTPLVTGYDPYDYVGTFNDKITKQNFLIKTDDGKSLKIVAFGENTDLVASATDVFKITIPIQSYTINGAITFKRDSSTNKVKSFTYKLDNVPDFVKTYMAGSFSPEGEATKDVVSDKWSDDYDDNRWLYFSGKSSSPYAKKDNDKDKSNLNQKSKNDKIKIDDVKIPLPKNPHQCDPNDKEWEIGCINDKIKYINKKVLGQDVDGIYTETLRNQLINNSIIPPTSIKLPNYAYDKVYRYYEKNLNEGKKLNEGKVDKINLSRFYKLVNKKL